MLGDTWLIETVTVVIFGYKSWERGQNLSPTVSHGPGEPLCSVEFYLIYFFSIVFILRIYYVGNYFLSCKAKTLNCLNNKNSARLL